MEVLSLFDVSDEENDEKSNGKQHNYPLFTPNVHEKYWYRSASTENQTKAAMVEIDTFRLVDMFKNGQFAEAIKLASEPKTQNNRSHEIQKWDTILQCFIEKARTDREEADFSNASNVVSAWKDQIVDFGDQIQFLRAHAQFLIAFHDLQPEAAKSFGNTMALLCHLAGTIENWKLFEQAIDVFFLRDSQKFGIKMKMASVLKYEMEQSKGFVKEGMRRKLEKVEREAKEFREKIGEEKAASIVAMIDRSIKDHHHSSEAASSLPSEFRAHESRSKNALLSEKQKDEAVETFRLRFSFLFEPFD